MTQEKHLECSHQTSNSVYDQISDDLEKSKNNLTSNKVNDEFGNFHSIERNAVDVGAIAIDRPSKRIGTISRRDFLSKINVLNSKGSNIKMTVITHQSSSENIRDIQTKIGDPLENGEKSEIHNHSGVGQSEKCELKSSNDKISECKHSENDEAPDVDNVGGRRPLSKKINDDPFARLNALRANISNVLKEVKAVLIEHGEASDDVPEEMKPAEENVIRFRFVKRIRKKSLFDENDNTDTSNKVGKTQKVASNEKANQLNRYNNQLNVEESASSTSKSNSTECGGKSIKENFTKLGKTAEPKTDNMLNMKTKNKKRVLENAEDILDSPLNKNNGDQLESAIKDKFINKSNETNKSKESFIVNNKKLESENVNSKNNRKFQSSLEEKSILYKKRTNEAKTDASNDSPLENVKKIHTESTIKENQCVKDFSEEVFSRQTDLGDKDARPNQSSHTPDVRLAEYSVAMKNNTEVIRVAEKCINQNSSASSTIGNSAFCTELDSKRNEKIFKFLDEKTAIPAVVVDVSIKVFNENSEESFPVIVGAKKNVENSNNGVTTVQNPKLSQKPTDFNDGKASTGKSSDLDKKKDEVHQKLYAYHEHLPKEIAVRPTELSAKQNIALEKVWFSDNLKPKLFSQTIAVGHLERKMVPATRRSSLPISVLANFAKATATEKSSEPKNKINLSAMKTEKSLDAIIVSQNKVESAAGEKNSDCTIKSSQKELVDKVHCLLKIGTSKIGAVAIKPTLTRLPSPAKAVQLMPSKSITVSVPEPVKVLIMDTSPNTEKLASGVIDESDTLLKKKSVETAKDYSFLQTDFGKLKETDWLGTEKGSTEQNEKAGEDLTRENQLVFETNDIPGDILKKNSTGKTRKIKKKVVIKRIKRRLSIDTPIPGKHNLVESIEPEICEKEIDLKTLEGDSQIPGDKEVQEEGEEITRAGPKSCLKVREYTTGQLVMYADRIRKTVKWKKATVIERVTSISYKLNVEGEEKSCHICYIKKYTDKKVQFGGKEYLEIDYAQEEEEEEPYNIWARA